MAPSPPETPKIPPIPGVPKSVQTKATPDGKGAVFAKALLYRVLSLLGFLAATECGSTG
jgi:hypothetical protein